MADGNTIKTEGFIAYQDEEHGLGFQVARDLVNQGGSLPGAPSGDMAKQPGSSYRLTSPRRTTADTLSALISKDAGLAVVPLQNDRAGYDKDTLGALIDFHDYQVVGERAASDKYVLAVPTALVDEQAEAAFPSSFRSVGSMPNGRVAQQAIRRRIGTIYATADALERCGAAIDGFRAQGIQISRLPDQANPYTDVLSEAYAMLDPDRTIQTSYSDKHPDLKRTSEIKGRNYGKALVGVLLPLDAVMLGDKTYHADARDASLASDYVVVDQGLVGSQDIETHFLVLQREPQKSGAVPKGRKGGGSVVDKIAGKDGAIARQLADVERHNSFKAPDMAEQNLRVLLKVDTRGAGVADTAELTGLMAGKLPYTPIVLNDRPDTLPTVYEVSLRTEADRKVLYQMLTKAIDQSKGWHPRFLGAFVSTRSMPEAPVAASTFPAWGYMLIGGGLVIAAAAAIYFGLIA